NSTSAWTSALPLTGETWVDSIALVGDTNPPSSHPSANYRFVGPDYFRTLSMPITKGRSIDERDRTSATTPAVLSARAAQTLWRGGGPMGGRFRRPDAPQVFQGVGVVADGHPTTLEAEPPLMVYLPYWFNNEGKSVLMVRTPGDATAIASELSRAIHGV